MSIALTCLVLHFQSEGADVGVGIGAIVLNGARIGKNCLIGAGALIWSMIVRRVAQSGGGSVTTATASEHDILDGIALSQTA